MIGRRRMRTGASAATRFLGVSVAARWLVRAIASLGMAGAVWFLSWVGLNTAHAATTSLVLHCSTSVTAGAGYNTCGGSLSWAHANTLAGSDMAAVCTVTSGLTAGPGYVWWQDSCVAKWKLVSLITSADWLPSNENDADAIFQGSYFGFSYGSSSSSSSSSAGNVGTVDIDVLPTLSLDQGVQVGGAIFFFLGFCWVCRLVMNVARSS